ncbi:hypothetical protein CBF45_07350 [Bordetella sp. J329]|nr:hypothetical protein CBF45_07350 [Bordetella sp. J329]
MPDIQVGVSLWLKVPPWEIARRHPAGRFYTVDVVADKAATPEQIADAIKRRLAEFEDRNESTAATSRSPRPTTQVTPTA